MSERESERVRERERASVRERERVLAPLSCFMHTQHNACTHCLRCRVQGSGFRVLVLGSMVLTTFVLYYLWFFLTTRLRLVLDVLSFDAFLSFIFLELLVLSSFSDVTSPSPFPSFSSLPPLAPSAPSASSAPPASTSLCRIFVSWHKFSKVRALVCLLCEVTIPRTFDKIKTWRLSR